MKITRFPIRRGENVFLQGRHALYKAAKWPQKQAASYRIRQDSRTGKNGANFSLLRSHRQGIISPQNGRE
ncbi:MAG: hypothetical protein LBG47_07480 [Prevotellaceae bacterium]|nr:hypothetical protein [Prevotellaceae bacterium]